MQRLIPAVMLATSMFIAAPAAAQQGPPLGGAAPLGHPAAMMQPTGPAPGAVAPHPAYGNVPVYPGHPADPRLRAPAFPPGGFPAPPPGSMRVRLPRGRPVAELSHYKSSPPQGAKLQDFRSADSRVRELPWLRRVKPKNSPFVTPPGMEMPPPAAGPKPKRTFTDHLHDLLFPFGPIF